MANGMYPSPPRHGLVLRPIVRDYWDEDVAAAMALAASTNATLIKGPEAANPFRLGGGRTAGVKIKPGIGGVYNPFRVDASFTGPVGGPPMTSGLE